MNPLRALFPAVTAVVLTLNVRAADLYRDPSQPIETRVNDELVKTGWDGDWSAESIIRDVLDR